MKFRSRTFSAIVIVALLFSLCPVGLGQKHYKELTFGKCRDVTIPQPKQVTLKNGIRVLLLEDHELPFIKMRGVFAAGSAWEPAEKAGLASICGTVMRTGGSQSMHGDQIDEELENIAASVETYIGVLEGSASLSTLKEHFDKVLTIYADVLMRPAFPPDKIELAKINMKTAISRRNDFVANIAAREFSQLIYGDQSPYARDVEYATVDAISRDDLFHFHKTFVRPQGMVLGVWGDFSTSDMLKKIRQTFEKWQDNGLPRPSIPKVTYDYRYTVNLVKKPEVTQSYIYIGHIGGKKDNPDLPALTLMNQIFGTSFNSRLFNRLRAQQGLSYRVEGVYGTNYAFEGKFYMALETQSSRTIEAIHSMLREMNLLTTELVSEEEMRDAVDSWLNSYVFDFEDKDEVMDRLLTYSFYGYPLDFLQQLRQKLEKVSREDILRVAKQYLHPQKVQILVVGNPADFLEQLAALGPVNEIDITIPTAKPPIPTATAESVNQAKALLQKMAIALGGREQISAIKNITTHLKVTQTTPMGEMTMDAQKIIVYPDKICRIMKTPMGEVKIIFNGQSGKMISPQGSMPAPESLIKQIKEGSFHDPLLLVSILDEINSQYVGESTFAATPADELIIAKGDLSYHLFLDRNSHLPLGIKFTTVDKQGPIEMEEHFQDYRKVGSVYLPFKIISFDKDKKLAEVTVTDAKIDEPVDLTIFE